MFESKELNGAGEKFMHPSWNKEKIAARIEHTLLKAEAGLGQVLTLCDEAVQHGFAAVCVNPVYVEAVAGRLKGTPVKPCAVVGFPLGANTPAVKVYEAGLAIKLGAREIDMVLQVGALKAGDHAFVEKEIRAVVAAAQGAAVKVIIEACYLNNDEKKMACELILAAGAQYVKTSTGLGSGGATLEDVQLLRSVVGDRLKIKAAGGIRTYEQAIALLEAGADRIGTSSGVAIVRAAQLSD
jgi:deoxyribose-phosphate aldolase